MRVVLLIMLLMSSFLQADEIKDLHVNYDISFYSGDYENAYKCVNKLIEKGNNQPYLFREKAKMAALTGRNEEVVSVLKKLKASGNKSDLDAISEVLSWERLPPECIEACRKNDFLRPKTFVLQITQKSSEDQKNDVPAEIVSGQKVSVASKRQVVSPSRILCYKSASGRKYHSIAVCSVKSSLTPVFDLEEVKKKKLTPCENCWKSAPLF